MTGLRVVIVALLVGCGAASRSEFMRASMFKKAMEPAGSPAASPAASPAGSPGPAAAPAGPCECVFHDMCTCEAALAQLDCISKTCASEECECPATQFSQSCGQMASVCNHLLDISCTPKQALCQGNYYQLSSSTTGLNIDIAKLENNAHCGPTGKCTGQVDIQAVMYNPEPGMHMECFLEDAPQSELKVHCSSEVHGDFASCTVPMPKEIPAGHKLAGWCRLVDRTNDGKNNDLSKRLTNDAPFYIYNHHKAAEEPEAPKRKMAEAPAPKPAHSGAFTAQGTAVFIIAAAAAAFHL